LPSWAVKVEISGKLTKRLLKWNDWVVYGIAAILPCIPIYLSRMFGMNENSYVADPSAFGKTVECIGYWHRLNWTSLAVLLPAALLVVRWTANRLFPLGMWPGSYRISDRPVIPQTESLAKLAVDGRNLIAALSVTIIIHLFDLKSIAYSYYLGKGAKRPPDWDWALWYLARPDDTVLRYKNMLLVIVAYISQFGLILLAAMLVILLLRHNLFYLRLIYLRDRLPPQNVDQTIVLNFDDQDLRFGLLPLSDQFNTQIKLLAILGSFTLVSRVALANVTELRNYLGRLAISDPGKIPWEIFGKILEYRGMLFPTVGQILFPICWLLMFAVVMLPARAKLIPLKVQKGPRGGARNYLLQFLPARSKIDIETESLTKSGSVDETAKLFARHSFWPVGDTTAQFLALIAFFVFFFSFAPVLPSSTVILGVLIYYVLLLVTSYVCSKFLFWLFEYRIRAVDPRLASTT
jgi:hypothetical protein